MIKNEYLELIEDLNESITNNKFFENLGISFSYTTNGYCHFIDFGDFSIYNSENDSLTYEEMNGELRDLPLKDFVIQQFSIFSEQLFNLSQELTKIKV